MPLVQPKPHGVFWVVMTLVLNTLVYALIVLIVLGMFMRYIVGGVALTESLAQAIMAVLLFCSVLAATQHSLTYIKRRAIVLDPAGCIVPAIASFAGIIAGLNALAIAASWRGDMLSVGSQLGSGVLSVLGFALLVRRFFRNLDADKIRGFEVQPRPVIPLAEKPPVQ